MTSLLLIKTITVSETANYVNVQTHAQLDVDFKKYPLEQINCEERYKTILKPLYLYFRKAKKFETAKTVQVNIF